MPSSGWQVREFHDGSDFDSTDAGPWNFCGDPNRLVKILSLNKKIATELFTRLRKRTIGD